MQDRVAIVIIIAVLVGVAALAVQVARTARRTGQTVAGNVIVRCRAGHLFTTIWIPLMSFKAIRLGLVRFQYCPVGDHWTFVVPVPDSKLTDLERRAARMFNDGPVP